MRASPDVLSAARRMARLASIFLISIGILTLLGWTFQIDVLKSVYGTITTKANTALTVVLAGIALLILTRDSRSALRPVGELCAAVVALIGAATLSEHIFGWNLGIDELLFTEFPGASATASPGRMGPPASTSFLLSGISMILVYRNKAISCSQALALIVILCSMLVLFGYAYKAEQLYEVPRYTRMSLLTALALLVLGFGLVVARLDRGLTAAIAGADAGGAMARRVLLTAILIPFLLGWLRLWGQREGYYDLGFGVALLILAITVLFSLSILRTAAKVSAIEQQRLKTENTLRTTQELFHVATKHLAINASTQDRDLRYTWIHSPEPAFDEKTMLGKREDEVFSATDAPVLMKIKKRVLETGVGAHEEVRMNVEGDVRFYDLTVEPLMDETGEIVGVISAAINVTDRKKTEESLRESQRELQQTLAAAEEASRLKDHFLATVSHELRTPLNAILGWTHMLQSQSVKPEMINSAIRTIYVSAKSQAKIIDDLLDVARIVSGKMNLHPDTVKLSDILSSSLATVAHAIKAKNIQVGVWFQKASENITLYADAQRLRQVFWNLLSNAVKFTPVGGKVEIRVSRNSREVIIMFRDTGVGINREFLPMVFERFRQADSSTTRKFGGLGLGLSITKNLVELHGGTVAVDSEGEGAGSMFTVRLPLSDARQRISTEQKVQFAATQEPFYDTNLNGRRILVVDNDEETLQLIREALENSGAECRISNSAVQGLKSLEEWFPDLLISDIAMPDRDGYWLIDQIRSLPAPARNVPAIALTALASSSDREKILQAGFRVFVSKPVEMVELLSAVRNFSQSRSLPSDNPLPEPSSDQPPTNEGLTQMLNGKKILMIEDDLLSTEVVRLALEDMGMEFRSAATASKALELFREWLPDVIISDLGLPDEDGYTLIKKIRAMASVQSARIPAIALTGYGKDDGHRAIAAGFQVYQSKPVEPNVLISLLSDLIRTTNTNSQ